MSPRFSPTTNPGGQANVVKPTPPTITAAEIEHMELVKKLSSDERRAAYSHFLKVIDSLVTGMQTGNLPR